jgi:galactokinase/mevalonate kinase-like predicted kinase
MSTSPDSKIDPSSLPPVSLDRMVRAVEKVKQRLLKTSAILSKAEIPFAVVGGNAVAAWVSRVDEAAVRNTQDVDILIRREDFDRVKEAMEAEGFIYGKSMKVDFFLDGPDANIRDSVHLLFASENVKVNDPIKTPDVSQVDETGQFPIVELEALVAMKLVAFRRKDQVHLLDMIEIELINAAWPAKFPKVLGDRLQQLLDDPDG